MIRGFVPSIILLPLLSGCVHGGLMPTLEHRQYSSAAFEYALIANNAYADKDWIELPSDLSLEVECDNDELGLAYSVFLRDAPGGREEYILAFRGTEAGTEGKKDWSYGNIRYWQQRKSEPIAEAFAKTYGVHDIVLVGHSLGGALAVHNSMRIADQRVYIFNSSPRFYAPPQYDAPQDASYRLSVVEQGEVLKAVRIFHKEAWQTYMPFNCFGKGSAFSQHSILKLGICLTRIAAAEPTPAAAARARAIIDANAWAIEETTHPVVPRVRPRPRNQASHICHTGVFRPQA